MATIRALPGFFVRDVDDDNACVSQPRLFRKFSLATGSWAELQARVTSLGARDVKVVYLVRHAEGIHNAAEREFGTERWEAECAKSDAYLDADLTPFGIDDARSKGPPAIAAERARGMPPIERVVVSTLSRAIQTAEIFFADYPPRAPFASMELCREIMGVHTCDKRVSRSQLARKFPRVDVTRVADEEDVLWSPTHRETDEEIQARALVFLQQLFDAVPERFVAVVTHSKFMRCLYDALLHGQKDVFPANCEVVPLVLERVPAQ
ncbi:hypothetical protein PybrP1_005768 [[Pythium] brassicae (nom. inval.)]|nr:hypothetical protein PybrP1_005768 [[Pythium] brassicae (nom. inval.)]